MSKVRLRIITVVDSEDMPHEESLEDYLEYAGEIVAEDAGWGFGYGFVESIKILPEDLEKELDRFETDYFHGER